MPGWSPEIANEFIQLAAERDQPLDQIQLQNLVYLAHGWCLASSDQPLTGDRPEACDFGPVYRRLADALACHGADPVRQEIIRLDFDPDWPGKNANDSARAELDQFEMDTIETVYADYGALPSSQLSVFTQSAGTPWAEVYAGGSGKLREIPHSLIRDQFAKIAEEPQRYREAE
jgi:Uncharacterized phage-associated protein